jgi:hypothetical protein
MRLQAAPASPTGWCACETWRAGGVVYEVPGQKGTVTGVDWGFKEPISEFLLSFLNFHILFFASLPLPSSVGRARCMRDFFSRGRGRRGEEELVAREKAREESRVSLPPFALRDLDAIRFDSSRCVANVPFLPSLPFRSYFRFDSSGVGCTDAFYFESIYFILRWVLGATRLPSLAHLHPLRPG